MININLLPEEYRRKQRTSVKLLLSMTGTVTTVALLAAWWAWLALGVRAEIESERSVLQTEMDGLSPQVAYHKSLEGEKQRYEAREVALAKITGDRINWTQKLDELIDVVHRGGEGERHYVWFDDFLVENRRDSRSGSNGRVRANGHSGSDNFAQVANFLEDLESSAFIQDFNPPAPPEGTQTVRDEDLYPPVVWAFPLTLDLRDREASK